MILEYVGSVNFIYCIESLNFKKLFYYYYIRYVEWKWESFNIYLLIMGDLRRFF